MFRITVDKLDPSVENEKSDIGSKVFNTKGEAEFAKKQFKKSHPGSKVTVHIDVKKAKKARLKIKEEKILLKRKKELESKPKDIPSQPVIGMQDPLAL